MKDDHTPTYEEVTLTYDEKLICEYLRKLRMPAMAKKYEEQLAVTNIDLMSFTDRFKDIIEAEWSQRNTTKLNKLLKAANLTYPAAELDNSLYNPDRKLDTAVIELLESCRWIDEGKNLLITGKTGSGKTYLSNAFCITAMQQGKTVRYFRAKDLMYELAQAADEGRYREKIKSLNKIDLVVIDDFGLMPLKGDMCRYLFDVIDDRDVIHASMIVISQLPVSAWFDMFNEKTYGDACLSRLTERRRSLRLEMNGTNMRDI